ncbi:ABC transporter permease [Enterococcus faecalis]
MKFLDILSTALTSLWRNKVRTILTILAVFIGSFAISLTSGVNIGVNEFITTQLGSIGAKDLIQVQAKQEDGTATDDDQPKAYNPEKNKQGAAGNFVQLQPKDVEKLKKLNGVKRIETSQEPTFEYVEGQNGKKYQFSASAVVPSFNLKMLAGKAANWDAQEPEVTILENYVKALGYKNNQEAVGKKLSLVIKSAEGEEKTVTATIVGVQEKNALMSSGDGWVNDSFAKEVLAFNQKGLPKSMTENFPVLLVTVKDADAAEKVKDEIVKAGYQASTFEDQVKTILNFVNAVTGGLILFGVISLIAATFGIVNTLFMSVQERTREIGLKKALGLSRGKVFQIFAWEAGLIGFFGSALGLLAAMGTGSIINSLAADSFLSGLPQLTLVQFAVVPSVSIILLIMLIAFLAGALPARRAARLDPIDALRSE